MNTLVSRTARTLFTRRQLLADAVLALGGRLAPYLDEEGSLRRHDPKNPEWVVTAFMPQRWPIEVRLGWTGHAYDRVAWLRFCDDEPTCAFAPWRVLSGNSLTGILYASTLEAVLAFAERRIGGEE